MKLVKENLYQRGDKLARSFEELPPVLQDAVPEGYTEFFPIIQSDIQFWIAMKYDDSTADQPVGMYWNSNYDDPPTVKEFKI